MMLLLKHDTISQGRYYQQACGGQVQAISLHSQVNRTPRACGRGPFFKSKPVSPSLEVREEEKFFSLEDWKSVIQPIENLRLSTSYIGGHKDNYSISYTLKGGGEHQISSDPASALMFGGSQPRPQS